MWNFVTWQRNLRVHNHVFDIWPSDYPQYLLSMYVDTLTYIDSHIQIYIPDVDILNCSTLIWKKDRLSYQDFLCIWKLIFPPYLSISTCKIIILWKGITRHDNLGDIANTEYFCGNIYVDHWDGQIKDEYRQIRGTFVRGGRGLKMALNVRNYELFKV